MWEDKVVRYFPYFPITLTIIDIIVLIKNDGPLNRYTCGGCLPR